MAQHDMNIANQGFPAFRADLNDALAALVSNSSGAVEPSTRFAHQFWVDTAANPSILKIRNADNDAWITIGEIDQTGDKFNLKCANATILENLTLNAQGDLRFADSDSSNWVAFQAPATVSSNITWTLPNADGTTGQALVTNGSGTLSWAAAGGTSGFDFISSTDLSNNATADFTLPSGYDAYQFVLGNVVPATDSVHLYVRTSSNGGSSFDAGGADYRSDASTATFFQVTSNNVGSSANEWGVSACVYVFHPHLSAYTFMRAVGTSQNADSEINNISRYAARLSTAAVNAVRFLYSSGNLESGTITLYGLKNS